MKMIQEFIEGDDELSVLFTHLNIQNSNIPPIHYIFDECLNFCSFFFKDSYHVMTPEYTDMIINSMMDVYKKPYVMGIHSRNILDHLDDYTTVRIYSELIDYMIKIIKPIVHTRKIMYKRHKII